MTRLEAIAILDGFKYNPLFNNQHYEALDMAISALENEGEWIDKGSLSCRCSKCGCKSTAETNFCAVCGADMRKGET